MTSTQKRTIEDGTCKADEVSLLHLKRQAIQQTMEKLPNGTRRLAAKLRTPIQPLVLWEVLTDYEELSKFIPNLSRSEIISRTENKVHLKQIGTQKFIGMKFSAQVQIALITYIKQSKRSP